MRESKECAWCGGIYFRAEGVSDAQWEGRRYCSSGCAGKAALNQINAAAKETAKDETATTEPVAVAPSPRAGPVTRVEPVQRELLVVRVGPNPRTVSCEYYELAERRMCTVNVKRNDKFVRGMRFKMAEPESELEFARPWVYTGPAPRRRGKW